jgi:hypothetical protein
MVAISGSSNSRAYGSGVPINSVLAIGQTNSNSSLAGTLAKQVAILGTSNSNSNSFVSLPTQASGVSGQDTLASAPYSTVSFGTSIDLGLINISGIIGQNSNGLASVSSINLISGTAGQSSSSTAQFFTITTNYISGTAVQSSSSTAQFFTITTNYISGVGGQVSSGSGDSSNLSFISGLTSQVQTQGADSFLITTPSGVSGQRSVMAGDLFNPVFITTDGSGQTSSGKGTGVIPTWINPGLSSQETVSFGDLVVGTFIDLIPVSTIPTQIGEGPVVYPVDQDLVIYSGITSKFQFAYVDPLSLLPITLGGVEAVFEISNIKDQYNIIYTLSTQTGELQIDPVFGVITINFSSDFTGSTDPFYGLYRLRLIASGTSLQILKGFILLDGAP